MRTTQSQVIIEYFALTSTAAVTVTDFIITCTMTKHIQYSIQYVLTIDIAFLGF